MEGKTHRKITCEAFKLCRDFLPDIYKYNVDFEREVTQGSYDEDNKGLDRALNWHFYRAEDSCIPKTYAYIFKTNSREILEKRISELADFSLSTFKRYNTLGRIIHHVQDMSTPSHVLPIYHGPMYQFFKCGKIKDLFEEFIANNQNSITADGLTAPKSIHEISNFIEIYDTAATGMLEILQSGFKFDNTIIPSEHFWKNYKIKESKHIEGFGAYGDCNHCFTTLDFSLCPDNLRKETLDNIQKTITNHAIINTCKTILYATNK